MSNYQPLSILNNDYKILAKTLAQRLERVIPSLIHIDQVGYIPGHVPTNNMRRLLHVLKAGNHSEIPAIAVSLDAMKAFDKIEWPFLLYTV